jgi:hypothetical protein
MILNINEVNLESLDSVLDLNLSVLDELTKLDLSLLDSNTFPLKKMLCVLQ